ncbi:MAG TPA: hypothetical protein VFX98_16745, partial [Longimicrobiaceae bacterium]|nr:hypothetical protein [Longimicrobiaceae bacterium]
MLPISRSIPMSPLRRSALLAALLLAPPLLAAPSPRLVSGRVFTADGGSAEGLRVFARAPGFADSAEVAPTGEFTLALPEDFPAEGVELHTDAADRDRRAYHPALARLRPGDLAREPRFVLVPRTWTVPAGTYAGVRVPISLDRAFEAPCEGCQGFYRSVRGDSVPPEARGVLGWAEEAFPLRIAFDRAGSGGPVSARDSAAFWQVVEALEEDFGRDLFRPGRLYDLRPGEDPRDLVLVWIDPSLGARGMSTQATFQGHITTGAVWLRRASLIRAPDGPALVQHELMHVLGMGHTCAWRSVLSARSRCGGLDAPRPTAEDVAYGQLLLGVRALQRRHGARWGAAAALAGE